MIRGIFLYGNLGQEFGEFHQLEVHSVAEACKAIGYRCKGFLSRVKDGTFEIIDGTLTDGKPIATNELDMALTGRELHIVPIIEGAGGGGGKGIVQAVVGVAIVAAAVAIPALSPTLTMGSALFGSFTFTNLAVMGGILAIGGISQALSSIPETNYATVDDSEASASSFLFNGAPQRYEQGGALPIIIGRHMAGPIFASGSIKSNQIVVGGDGSSDSGDNSPPQEWDDNNNQWLPATFNIDTYSWRALIDPSGTITAPKGANILFKWYPADEGTILRDVKIDDVTLPTPFPTEYLFTNVTANHTVRVTYY